METKSLKKPVVFILVISIVIVLLSVLTILSLGENKGVKENIIKTNFKDRGTVSFSKRGEKKKPGPVKKKRRKKVLIDKIFSKLKLTEAQKAQIKKLKEQKPSQREKETKIKELRKKLNHSFGNNTGQEEIQNLYEQIQDLKNQMAFTDLQYILKIRKILTPRQRKKFQRLRKKYKRRSRKKRYRF